MLVPLCLLLLASPSLPRSSFLQTSSLLGVSDALSGLFGGRTPPPPSSPPAPRSLGASGISVSPLALGTQRWVSSDFNAPDEVECFAILDAAYEAGCRTIDTAESYPIPSSRDSPEGSTEEVIGRWMEARSIPRQSMTICTKITGATNVSPASLRSDLMSSLKRLRTSYVDVYLLHWPQRYSPQSNWGQSLAYNQQGEYRRRCSFEELVTTMGQLEKEGKIRGWGLCNDSAYGLTKSCVLAKALSLPPPCAFQGDFSLLDRKAEENGVLEAASPFNEDVGFMAYNVLAGGQLTGKYLGGKAAGAPPRGRFDTRGWGGTLYRYRSGPAADATKRYAEIARSAGVPLGELAVRWALGRDGVSTLLLGHSDSGQLRETLAWAEKGALPGDVMFEIDRVHMRNRNPIFANDAVPKDFYGAGAIGEPIP